MTKLCDGSDLIVYHSY